MLDKNRKVLQQHNVDELPLNPDRKSSDLPEIACSEQNPPALPYGCDIVHVSYCLLSFQFYCYLNSTVHIAVIPDQMKVPNIDHWSHLRFIVGRSLDYLQTYSGVITVMITDYSTVTVQSPMT